MDAPTELYFQNENFNADALLLIYYFLKTKYWLPTCDFNTNMFSQQVVSKI